MVIYPFLNPVQKYRTNIQIAKKNEGINGCSISHCYTNCVFTFSPILALELISVR